MPSSLRRSRRLALAMTVLAGLIVATTPVTWAANATDINTILPTGRKIIGKLVSDIDGTPIANADIDVVASDYSSSGSATTGADGKFTVVGLKGGAALTYSVDIDPDNDKNAPGCYTAANADRYGTGAACDTWPSPQTAPLNVPTLDLGIIRAAKGYTISGTVKGGTATTSTALVGVNVDLDGDEYDSVATTAGGAFSFKGLAPGTYQLAFYTPSTMNYRDGVWNSGTATKYSATTASNIVITTANKTASVILPAGSVVSGYVKTGAGVALPNAWVNLSGSKGDEDAFTDATGKYVLKGVANGTDYQLEVEAPYQQNYQSGYWTTNTSHFVVTPNAGSTFAVSGNKDLGTTKLPAGFRIKGKVVDSGGAPAQFAGAYADGPGSAYASTAADGTFTIVGLEPGSYIVQISAPYDKNLYGGWFDAGTATNRFTLVEANADAKTLNSTTTLWDIGTVKLKVGHTISGVVKGGNTTTSTVLAGASVGASTTGGGAWDYGYATTNASGAYTIIGLIPGQYRVSFYPKTGQNYRNGYWKSGAAPNYTDQYGMASIVTVGP